MKKKVGLAVVTYKDNFGSALQTYATQKIVKQLGYDTEIFDISGISSKIMKNKILFFLLRLFKPDEFKYVFEMAKSKFKKNKNNDYAKNMEIRHEVYKKFYADYLEFGSGVQSWDNLITESEKYSSVIVGSDQLWRPSNIAGRYFTLEFVPEHINKIAYSTSFGVSILPNHQKKHAERFLRRIEHISVREETGKQLVKELTDRDVPVVCDPTMLFNEEQWMEIQDNEPFKEGDYILMYLLGDNKEHREYVKRLKEKTGYPVVGLLHGSVYIDEDEEFVDNAPYNVGPGEFINLIRNAKFMCTDSFHGMIFSILNTTPFFAFRRYSDDSEFSTNDRIYTLLKRTGLNSRIIYGTEDIEESLKLDLDFENALNSIKTYRQNSLKFLRKALETGDAI